jgi:hypothetical protein
MYYPKGEAVSRPAGITGPAGTAEIPMSKGVPMRQGFKRFFGPAAVLAILSTAGAFAQQAASIPDDQVRERLSFVEKALDAGRPRARTWWYGWIAAYSAGTAVQWGLSLSHWNDTKPADDPNAPRVHDRTFAQDMLVGGATTALGVGGLLIDPFLPAAGSGDLKNLPESTAGERLAKLSKAEDLLRRCAQREKDGQGWTTHLLNLGVNAAAGVVTSAVFDRPWTDGLITFAAGEVVSLLTIYSQPRRAIHDWSDYEAGYLGRKGGAIPEGSPESRWTFGLFPGGFSVGLTW